ncbi:biliverdin-producing heme oxygenase [Flavobacterium sp. DGU38]|uniref:Biliverdin-producing heme oxygenase n=1 Tax=Flavobacterium calami TaxID=3139144 RepID=A0ABU9IJ84_9FLAO
MNTDSTLISSDFLNDLKTQTAHSHKKLEALPISLSIVSQDMKIEEYINYLSLMHDVHQDTENIIYPMLSEIVKDLDQRKKRYLIEDDLLFLNYKKNHLSKVFQDTDINIPFALGVLYVIEGSTLGGRFILKNVSKFPELSGNNGTSYFNGYGDKTGSYWKAFLNILSGYERDFNCGDEIIKGAKYAFDSIHNHFQNA